MWGRERQSLSSETRDVVMEKISFYSLVHLEDAVYLIPCEDQKKKKKRNGEGRGQKRPGDNLEVMEPEETGGHVIKDSVSHLWRELSCSR